MGTATGTSMDRKSLPLSQPLLDLFWDLALMDEKKQIEATSKLVIALRDIEKEQEVEPEKSQKRGVSKSMEYTLGRLIKGVASNRGGVRYGFAAALTVILQEFPEVKSSSVLHTLDEHLKIKEPKDLKSNGVGQIFIYMALINAGRVRHMAAADVRTVVQNILSLEKEKGYLKSAGIETLVQVVQMVKGDIFESSLLPLMRERMSLKFDEMDLDDFMLILRVYQYHKAAIEPLFKQTLKHSDLLDSSHVDEICRILFSARAVDVSSSAEIILEAFQAHGNSFPVFWKRFVEIAAGETPAKMKVLFEVANHLLQFTTDPKEIGVILSSPFLLLLLQHSTKPKARQSDALQQLHDAAVDAYTEVLKSVKSANDRKLTKRLLESAIAPEFLGEPLTPWVEFMRAFTSKVDIEDLVKISKKLIHYLDSDGERKSRVSVIKYLGGVLQDKASTAEDVQGLASVIKYLGQKAFMAAETDDDKALAASAFKVISEFLRRNPEKSERPKHNRKDVPDVDQADPTALFKIAVLEVLVPGQDQRTMEGLLVDNKVKQRALQIAKKSDSLPVSENIKSVVKLLAMFTAGFWVLYRPVLAKEIADELVKIDRLLREKPKSAKHPLPNEDAMFILIQFFVSMLTVERTVFDTMELLFKRLCSYVNLESMNLLMEIVAPEAEEDEDQEMVEGSVEFVSTDEEGEGEESDVEEEEEEEPMDLANERATLQKVPGVAEEDGEESEPEMDDAAMFQIDKVLAEILRNRMAQKNKEVVDPRARALRLILLYAQSHSAQPLILLTLISPLMQVCLEKPDNKERDQHMTSVHFATKIFSCFKEFKTELNSKVMKKAFSQDDIVELLENSVAATNKVVQPAVNSAFIEATLFTQRVFLAYISTMQPVEKRQLIHKIYVPFLQQFMLQKRSLPAEHLLDKMLNGLGSDVIVLTPDIMDMIISMEDRFPVVRQGQLIVILRNVLQKLPSDVSSEDVVDFFQMIGKEFLKAFVDMKNREGVLSRRRRVEDLVDFVRWVMEWFGRMRKKGKVEGSLKMVWDFEELKKVGKEVAEKLEGLKDFKGVRLKIQHLGVALDYLVKREGGAGGSVDNIVVDEEPAEIVEDDDEDGEEESEEDESE